MTNIIIGGVEQFSIVDYPNQIAAVVFMQGCPWRCPFCYNNALQKIGQPTDFLWPKFVDFLKKRQGILDAVVFSGGEPLVQDGLSEAISEIKALGYKIGLHTGGYRPEHFATILPLLDWVGFDIKTEFDAAKYSTVTVGGSTTLDNILKSLDMLIASGLPFECRTTCDPRILTVEELFKIAEVLKAKGVKSYYLQKYRPIPADTITTEAACEDIVSDSKLLAYLQANFANFEVRK